MIKKDVILTFSKPLALHMSSETEKNHGIPQGSRYPEKNSNLKLPEFDHSINHSTIRLI
jgi:hypothetical protein